MVPEASLDFDPFDAFSNFGTACYIGFLDGVVQVILHSSDPTNTMLRVEDLRNSVHTTLTGQSASSSWVTQQLLFSVANEFEAYRTIAAKTARITGAPDMDPAPNTRNAWNSSSLAAFLQMCPTSVASRPYNTA